MDDKRRRLATKRFNEHIKLLASVLNGAAIVTIGAAVVAPVVSGSMGLAAPFWSFGAIALHLVGQAALRLLRDEG